METLLTWLFAGAAGLLAWRAFLRLNAMHWKSPPLLMISAYTMAVSAAAIVLGAVYSYLDYVHYGTGFAVVGVAIHIVSDRRSVRIESADLQPNERRCGERRAA